jgi:hypothetical protein
LDRDQFAFYGRDKLSEVVQRQAGLDRRAMIVTPAAFNSVSNIGRSKSS